MQLIAAVVRVSGSFSLKLLRRCPHGIRSYGQGPTFAWVSSSGTDGLRPGSEPGGVSVGASYYGKESADIPADPEKSDQGAAHAKPVLSTYYGEELAGSPTASGEPFNPYGFTAAHPYLPLGTKLLVNYNGRSVIVMVNDRGPYGSDYELDLSSGAAQAIGLADVGSGVVGMEVLDP